MKHFAISGAALGSKIKDSARRHNLDTSKFASRHAAQRVLDHLSILVTPFYIAGGLTVDPRLREASDADIVALRKISRREMHTGFKCIHSSLKREGIEVTNLSDQPREITFDYGNPVNRWRVTANAGGIRANFDLDITYANGWGSRPLENVKTHEIPSLMNGVPAFRAPMQPQSTSMAQKMLAVLMQPRSDLRVKHLADVVTPHIWSPRPDPVMVALEIHRIAFDRGIPTNEVRQQYPEILRWSVMERLEANWDKDANAGRTGLTLTQAWTDVNALWSDVHDALVNVVPTDTRRWNYLMPRRPLEDVRRPVAKVTPMPSLRIS